MKPIYNVSLKKVLEVKRQTISTVLCGVSSSYNLERPEPRRTSSRKSLSSDSFFTERTAQMSMNVTFSNTTISRSTSTLAQTSATAMQVAGRWKSSQMPAHYAKAELAERGAIARFKDGKARWNT